MARYRGLEMSNTYEFRFRRRYNLPPTDPRFLACTLEDIVIDYWAHAHVEDPKLSETLATTDDYENEVARMEAELAAELEAEASAEPENPPGLTAEVTVTPDPEGDPGEEWETVTEERYGAAGLS